MTTPSLGLQKAPAPGLKNPVHDAQKIFKVAMNALARPGSLQEMPELGLEVPAPLTQTVAALALTLLDYDTPVYLDPALAQEVDVVDYLRFHTGAPIVALASDAAFALISDPAKMSAISGFAVGTDEYPDRSTTLLIAVDDMTNTSGATLSGPGIKTETEFDAAPLSPAFWPQMIANQTLYPLGVDVLFASPTHVAGLPRSSKISMKEAR
ncbi:phosphonate C-P lyase system protein PhnH [Pseudovibrio exalbescens]|uniref:phosphonate C-P lyase system protein PhnH n=1 Tax=Pseudovibrio exalbescens TaxID=197461 RepID=UPI002366A748|nr:phosphonate C-P lyase system protein PhnH [Pseudovibrio exalbescens]MDD7911784.1 phosphonate C-P lyase system protein PhnH [Pseudovibrio exalbescens]